MEFLDPKAERRHRLMLILGYGLLAIAIGFASLVMLYYSYGYSLGSEGDVQQNGLVLVSSTPEGATVAFNGRTESERTNGRYTLKSGDYRVGLSASGYNPWAHDLSVQGGDVQRFDYALLFPTKLQTTSLKTFGAVPHFASQSPDRKWLIIKENDLAARLRFVLYDMRRSDKPVEQELTFGEGVAAVSEGSETWTALEWSSDNRHLLLEHRYTVRGAQSREYILLDRTDGALAINLTTTLALSPAEQLELFDKKADRFYAYNTETKILRSFDRSGRTLLDSVERVRAYESYGSNTLLYVADLAPTDKQVGEMVNVVLVQGSKSVVLRRLPAAATAYPLDIAKYGDRWYVAAGANTLKGVYLYRDPLNQEVHGSALPKPWRFLAVQSPAVVNFSGNSRFLMVANGQTLAVYDAENITTHRFTLAGKIDAPQATAAWMDGYRLTYVSDGLLQVVEFDNTNPVRLQATSAAFLPIFSSDNKYVFSVSSPDATGVTRLESTGLRVVK